MKKKIGRWLYARNWDLIGLILLHIVMVLLMLFIVAGLAIIAVINTK